MHYLEKVVSLSKEKIFSSFDNKFFNKEIQNNEKADECDVNWSHLECSKALSIKSIVKRY